MASAQGSILNIEEIQSEERMRTFMSLRGKKTWISIKEELNERRSTTNMAQLINDMREDFRKEALRQLDDNRISIDEDWECLQQSRLANGPDEVFPLVATRWLLSSLPDSMTKCNVCGDAFMRGDDIIRKACGKHALHRFCLTSRLNENEVPLYGPCGCNSGGYAPELWRLLSDQQPVHQEPTLLAPPPQAVHREDTPPPWIRDIEDLLLSASPYDSENTAGFGSSFSSSFESESVSSLISDTSALTTSGPTQTASI
ncbi:hypothetical protein HIM_09843 [Hirsutella minnesotensis 3608]|uniref:Uncharacterized protein n=1 Tax=Hirsutella minnesotensis 3608 TaxID=1043627 RepID=A0A0F7ZHT6_9HYPO|nr:hypothetical protein HIM_12635 [Hirsutella minnesotensis 3608]KJZ70759.1 hypothetical protein HIM_09843 [Hirsutella minnesotensis 3608]